MVHRSRRSAADSTLVRAVLGGDAGAYAELISRYQRLVYGLGLALLLDSVEAETGAQQVFVRAFRHLTELDDPDRFPQWLHGRALRQFRLDALHKRLAWQVFCRLKPGHVRPRQVTRGPEDVFTLLGPLPEPHRITATLYLMGGYTQEEVAEFMDTPEGTIHSRMHDVYAETSESTVESIRGQLREQTLRFEFVAAVLTEIGQAWRETWRGEDAEREAALAALSACLDGNAVDADGLFAEWLGQDLAGFGLVSLEEGPKLWQSPDDDRGHVLALYVRPVYRGRGLGGRLLARMEDYLKQSGCRRVSVRPLDWQVRLARCLPPPLGDPSSPEALLSTGGVDTTSPGYAFLFRRGYRPTGLHALLEWPLARYQVPDAVRGYEKDRKAEGFQFKTASSRDLGELLDCVMASGNRFLTRERWVEVDPRLFQIARTADDVIAFAGPRVTDAVGRAALPAIYVRAPHRRRKLATVLLHHAARDAARHGATHLVEDCPITDAERLPGAFLWNAETGFRTALVRDPDVWKIWR